MGQHAVGNIEQRPTQSWMCIFPDLHEVSKVISMTCDGKFPGTDRLHPEVIKRGGWRSVEVLSTIIKDVWENLEVTADCLTIFKKRDRRDCGNYRGISLLSTLGKVFARIRSIDYRPYLRHNVGSALTEEPRIWSPSCEKYRRNALNRICPATWYLPTSQMPSTPWTGKRYGISCWNKYALTTSSDSVLLCVQEWRHQSMTKKWNRAVFLASHCSRFFLL